MQFLQGQHLKINVNRKNISEDNGNQRFFRKKVDTKNISSAVKFLIKNDNITGQIINVDSGQRLWKTPDIINSKE